MLALSQKERASFDGPYRQIRVQGPVSLFRLCGKNASGQANDPLGRYWFNEKFFWNMVDVVTSSVSNNAKLNHYLRFILRESTAVCHDWNSFASIYQFSLPARVPIDAVIGRIAAQPYYSVSDPMHRRSLPHEVLVGGEFQYIIDLKSDPSVARYVQGPRPLLVHRGGSA